VLVGGAGGATLAFLLLVLCGVSGAAVLDPALGAWGAAISSRLDGQRASRTSTSEIRLAGVRSPTQRAAAARRVQAIAELLVAPAVPTSTRLDALTRSGRLGLPPPVARTLA